MSDTITFDGHDLTSLFVVDHTLSRALPSWQQTTYDVPGTDGSIFAGTRAGNVQVTVRLWCIDDTIAGRQAALRTLASWLAVESRRPLVLGDEGGRYRMAATVNVGAITALYQADWLDVTFDCEPILYGATQTATVSANGSTTITVDGTAPTMPSISVSRATKDSSLGVWRLSTDGGSQRIDIPLTLANSSIVANCAERTLRVNGVVRLPTTASDWLELEPGTHTLSMTGSGTATVSWVERWW